jgi:hypothetical protein
LNANGGAPTHAKGRGAEKNTQHRNYSLDPLNTVLERVENLRISGDGWRGDCPNGHRSRGSLSILQRDDGTPWIECWSGCDKDQILQGLGLEWKDLFWRKDYHRMTPQEKREIRDKARQAGWKTVLEILPLETLIVQIASVDLLQGKPLSEADHLRLELAVKRISSARAVLCGH